MAAYDNILALAEAANVETRDISKRNKCDGHWGPCCDDNTHCESREACYQVCAGSLDGAGCVLGKHSIFF